MYEISKPEKELAYTYNAKPIPLSHRIWYRFGNICTSIYQTKALNRNHETFTLILRYAAAINMPTEKTKHPNAVKTTFIYISIYIYIGIGFNRVRRLFTTERPQIDTHSADWQSEREREKQTQSPTWWRSTKRAVRSQNPEECMDLCQQQTNTSNVLYRPTACLFAQVVAFCGSAISRYGSLRNVHGRFAPNQLRARSPGDDKNRFTTIFIEWMCYGRMHLT